MRPSGPGRIWARTSSERRAICVPGVRARILGVLVADHPVGPVEQQHPVLGRHAHDVGQRQQRQLGGDFLGEVGPAPVDDRADESFGTSRNCGLQRSHCTRRERAHEQATQPRVLRWVLVQHHPLDELQHGSGLGVANLRPAEMGRERPRIAQHPVHQLMGEHRPEAWTGLPPHELRFGHPLDRCVCAQVSDQIVRHATHKRARVEQRHRVKTRLEPSVKTRLEPRIEPSVGADGGHGTQPAISCWGCRVPEPAGVSAARCGGVGGLVITKNSIPVAVTTASATNPVT